MLVPGLSGGSVAIALKIYDEILSRFSHFFKNIKNNFFYFLQLIIGGLLGMFISSITLLKLLNINYYLIISIVLGLMSFIILKNFNYNSQKKWYLIFIVLGGFLLFGFNQFSQFSINNELIYFVIAGILLAIAFILPGISFAYVLLLLDLYEPFLLAIAMFDFVFLFKIGISFIFGLILTAKLLDYLFNKFNQITNNIVIGFVIASMLNVIPFDNVRLTACLLSVIFSGAFFGLLIRK